MKLWIARDLSNKISLISDKPKLQFINNYDTPNMGRRCCC